MQGFPKPRGKTFLFVNKSRTSTHLSRSLSTEKSKIQQHAQTGRKRSRKNKRASSILTSSSTSDGVQIDSHEKLAGERDTSQSQHQLSLDVKETVECDQSLQLGYRQALREDQALDRERSFAASLTGQRILCERDPFNVASVPISAPVASLLHYYAYHHHPSQWPNEMVLLRHGIYIFHDALLSILRTAVTDKLTMYCLLSAAACRIQFVDGLPCPTVAGKESHYIDNAVRLLRSSIVAHDMEDPEQLKSLLICISFLNSAEAYREEIMAAKTHLTAAIRLLEPMGGLKFVGDESLRGRLAMADLFIACVNLEACSLDCFYDPGPAISLNLQDHELQVPSTVVEASSLLYRPYSLVPPTLLKLIEEVAESHSVRSRMITSSMLPLRVQQVTHWITLRNMAIRNRLLAFRATDLRNHALRIAIIMWTLLAMNVTGRAKTVKLMAPSLRQVLTKISALEWANNEDVRFWILLVGLQCARSESEASVWFMGECTILFAEHIPSLTPVTQASDLADQLVLFQRSFFYDDQVQSARSHDLAYKLRNSSL